MDIDLDLPIERIFKESLGLRKGEKILLITDDYDDIKNRFNDRKFIAQCFKKVASKFDSPLDIFVYSAQKNHGEEPPIDLWLKCFGQSFCNSFFKYLSYEDVKNKKVYLEELLKYEDKVDKNHFPDVIIAISYFSTSHTLFRKFANYLGCRYASMPMVEKEMFAGPLNIDYNDLEKKTLELGKKIIDYKGVHIENDGGTDIFVNFANSKINFDTGNLKQKGSFGNLPAGEVFLAPQLEKTSGKVRLEYFDGKEIVESVFMVFKDGIVVDLIGSGKVVSYLDKIFNDERNRVIAELGFGTNNKAKNQSNVLEAEKIEGTCHIAIGDNITFGGNNRATVHIDFVISNPRYRWL